MTEEEKKERRFFSVPSRNLSMGWLPMTLRDSP